MTATWDRRRDRAGRLAAERPHARALLSFYADLVALQKPIAHLVTAPGSPVRLPGVPPSDGVLPLDRLPVGSLSRPFGEFARAVGERGPERLGMLGRRLGNSESAVHCEVLATYLALEDLHVVSSRLDAEPAQVEFFARGFLQPIAEALVGARALETSGWRLPICPACGRLPQVSSVRDEPHAKGRRRLECALCGTSWPFARIMCPACLEDRPDRLARHVAESTPAIGIDECLTCRRYLKSVDLRLDGAAVPVVDDLATAELDLWAIERGLTKSQRNVLAI